MQRPCNQAAKAFVSLLVKGEPIGQMEFGTGGRNSSREADLSTTRRAILSKQRRKKMRKHFGVWIVVMVLALMLTACVMPDGQVMTADGAAPVQTEAKDWPLVQDLRICHIIELGHPYSTAKVTLAGKEAEVFGFTYDVYDTQGDIPNEIRLIEDCITKQYDVIALVPYDTSALNDALREAQEAGIPVIAEGADLDEEGLGYVNTMIGSSGWAEGETAGMAVCQALEDGQGWVIIEGATGHGLVPQRSSAREYVAENCPGRELVAVDTGMWNREEARTVMENYLTAYPDQIHMVYCHNDDMCLGAVRAIAEAGLQDTIKVLGVDGGAKEVYDAIRDGTMWGTVLNDASFIAVKIIQSARDLAENRPVIFWQTSPAVLITKENVDLFPNLW